MNVDLTGTLVAILPIENVNDNFQKKGFVVQIDEELKYPQKVIAYAVNSRIDLVKNLSVGQAVNISCNLRGRETKDKKYYISLEIWKAETL